MEPVGTGVSIPLTYLVDGDGNTKEVDADFELNKSGTTTSIENEAIEVVSSYPNPGSNTLNLKSDNKIDNIEMLDVKGNIVLSVKVNSKDVSITTSTLASGLYNVKALIYEKEHSFKWVKK